MRDYLQFINQSLHDVTEHLLSMLLYYHSIRKVKYIYEVDINHKKFGNVPECKIGLYLLKTRNFLRMNISF